MTRSLSTTKFVMLTITYECNLHCSYCYEPKTAHHVMSLEMAKRVVRNIFSLSNEEYKCVEFDLMGGEPLLRFDFIRDLSEWMMAQAWPLDYTLFAATNGTLLSDEMEDWFYAHRDKVVLGLSLDGTDYMQNINRSNSSSSINIDFFLRTWPEQMFKMTISPQTLSHLYEGVLHLESRGIDGILTNLAFGVDWPKSALAVYRKQLERLVSHYIENPNIKRCSLLRLDLESLLFNTTPRKFCGCGVGTVLYDYDGKVYPCQMFSPLVLPEEKQKQVAEINFSDDSAFFSPTCTLCVLNKACPRCYGMEYKIMGNVSSPSGFHCNAFKIQVLENAILQNKLLIYEKDNIKRERMNDILNMLNQIKF